VLEEGVKRSASITQNTVVVRQYERRVWSGVGMPPTTRRQSRLIEESGANGGGEGGEGFRLPPLRLTPFIGGV
jgi:hypothetical protein